MFKDWYHRRTKLEIVSIVLVPILILTTVILSLTKGNGDTDVYTSPSVCISTECVKAANRLSNIINSSVDPCDNFYDFVCGNFIESDIEYNEVSSFLDLETMRIKLKLKRIVNESISNQDTNSLKLAKQLFRVCQQEHNVTDDGKILKFVEELGGWPILEGDQWHEDGFDWLQTMIKARQLGLDFDWFLDLDEDEETLIIKFPTNLARSDENVKSYQKYLIRKLTVHFSNQTINETEIDQIIDFQEKLAEIIKNAQLTYKPDNDLFITYERYTQKYQKIDWFNFFNNITIPDKIQPWRISMCLIKTYYDNLQELLEKASKRTVANYIIWRVVLSLSPHMSKTIQNDILNYLTVKTKKVYDLSDVCFETLIKRMGNVLESDYYRRHNIENFENNSVLLALIAQIKDRLRNNKWLDQSTRSQFVERYDRIKIMLGGFDNFRNSTIFDNYNGYDKFQFSSDNMIDMITQLKCHEYETKFNRLGATSYMKPRIVMFDWSLANAAFLIDYNTIVAGLGILQEEYYKEDRPNYLNYGGIGCILSHELSHVLDTIYQSYIERTGFTEWISQQALRVFNKKIQCISDNYKDVTKQLYSNITGNILQDLADFIAVDVAYEAYQKSKANDLKLPNFQYDQNQLFWIQYSSFLCYKKVKFSNMMASGDTYLLSEFRINGPIRNSKYFAKDFNCSVDKFMNPQEKCRII